MSRLILRFTDNKCMSTDMFADEWEPALYDALRRKKAVFPDKVVEQIEVASYDREFRSRFRYRALAVDLATWSYTPPPLPEPVPVKAKRGKRKAAIVHKMALPARPSRRAKKAA
jgi:hypothetical protein